MLILCLFRPSRLPIVLGTITGVLGLLAICLVIWFFCAKRRRRNQKVESHSSSSQSSQDLEACKEKISEDEQISRLGGLRGSWTPSQRPLSLIRSKSKSSSTQTKTKKQRIVSMGGVTHSTGTTSNTVFVVAAPPTPHPGSQSNPSAEQLSSHQFYNPQRPTSPPMHTADNILREGAAQNAQLIFGHRNGQ